MADVRLVTYFNDGWRGGVLLDDQVVDLADVVPGSGRLSVVELLRQGIEPGAPERARECVEAGRARPLAGLRLGPPVADPEKILCIGLNYRAHAVESNQEPPPTPVVFAKFRNSLRGPTEEVAIPAACTHVDYEGELAVVIGRRASGVSPEEALDYIYGAMVLNDLTDRQLQMGVSQWTVGKAIDGFAPCGPALVPLAECGPLDALRLSTTVNGDPYQDSSTSDLIFDVPFLVSYLSRTMTLEPGDIISTGTPAGVGFGVRPARYLAPGDVVAVTIDGIGTVTTTMVAPG